MKQVLFLLGVMLLLFPLQAAAAEDLPFAAGICANKATLLIREEKIGPDQGACEIFSALTHPKNGFPGE